MKEKEEEILISWVVIKTNISLLLYIFLVKFTFSMCLIVVFLFNQMRCVFIQEKKYYFVFGIYAFDRSKTMCMLCVGVYRESDIFTGLKIICINVDNYRNGLSLSKARVNLSGTRVIFCYALYIYLYLRSEKNYV